MEATLKETIEHEGHRTLVAKRAAVTLQKEVRLLEVRIAAAQEEVYVATYDRDGAPTGNLQARGRYDHMIEKLDKLRECLSFSVRLLARLTTSC